MWIHGGVFTSEAEDSRKKLSPTGGTFIKGDPKPPGAGQA